jgi:NAD(P)-dependent dehydrogenase (short-subunit alcohol dehydrogenase family)
MSDRFVLVTGASTGIGKACAIHLTRCGFIPIAGVRREEDAKKLELIAAEKIRCVTLDIAKSDSIAAGAKKIEEICGDSGLAGVVNNAGIGVHGPVEFVPRDDWRKQFEVNVFGHVEVTQAMLPLVRKYVASSGYGSGRIVFIGSIAGRVAMPIMAPYCASKHAIAAVAGSLRTELEPQGIQVSLIEPGAIQSEIWRKGQETAEAVAPDAPARVNYGPMIDAVIGTANKSEAAAIPASEVATLVERCLTAEKPPRRKLVGRDAKMAAIAKRFLPESWFDGILKKALKI